MSVGEAADRLSILKIKQELMNAQVEDEIHSLYTATVPESEILSRINRLIWNLDDNVRNGCSPEDESIYLRCIFWLNSWRAIEKRKIDENHGSQIEPKSFL